MAAPKGNKFWELRSKHGRDKLFASPELMWQAACEYFEWCISHPWMKMEQTKARSSLRITTVNGKPEEFSSIDPQSIIGLPTERPFTLTGLCLYLGCSESYFRAFKSTIKEKDIDFLTIIARIEQVIETQQFEGATVGAYNANIIARKLGLTDKSDITSDGEKINLIFKRNDKSGS
jgi:hypothetical protein